MVKSGGQQHGPNSRKKENPFDKFANSKKKHDVVNRKVKGEDRNVGRSLARAQEERKKRLLKEFNLSKKSNKFSDRRFGEQDENLSLEDKMLLRFQSERVKKARNSAQFNLADESEEVILTHKGTVLGSDNYGDNDWSSDDEVGLGKEVVSSLHFGGGLVSKGDTQDDHIASSKNRMTALQEIVTKSKLQKLQKKETKLVQEEERERMDAAFENLVDDSMLEFRPTKRDRSEDDDTEPGKKRKEKDDYDTLLREMAFDVKSKVTDRTKTEEEIAIERREKMEKLEAERLKRMKSSYDPDVEEAEKALAGKKNGKSRASSKRPTDDEVDETFGGQLDEDHNELNLSEAAGHVDYGLGDVDDEEWEESDGEADDDQEDGSEDQEEGGEEDESEDGDDDDDDEGGDLNENEESEDNDSNHDYVVPSSRKESKNPASDAPFDNMPHKIPCPQDLQSFDELINDFVAGPEEEKELIRRILAWNSVHLPAPDGPKNRGLMHNFLDILLKHFARVGDCLSAAEDAGAQRDIEGQLDFLCKAIFTLSRDLSDACAPLWGRSLKIFESQLQRRLRDAVQGTASDSSSCWPSLGRLLLLKLAGQVFAVTDYRHAITGSIVLFLCQMLSQCAVATPRDLASGLLVASIILDFTAETKAFVPECLSFLNSVLTLYGERNAPIASQQLKEQQSFHREHLVTWLRKSAESSVSIGCISWTSFKRSALVDPSEMDDQLYSFAASALSTVLTILKSLAERLESCEGFPELFENTTLLLRSINCSDTSFSAAQLVEQSNELLHYLLSKSLNAQQTRLPLQWRKQKVAALETKNPRFEMEYKLKKDFGQDERKAQLKQLNRAKKREQKAAMRELRRDSDFLEQERYRERSEKSNVLRDERHKNFAWMEAEQATINQQVRKGSGLMKGGGSGVAKIARIKRK